MTVLLTVRDLSKTFVLHGQGGVAIRVLQDVSLAVAAGECVCLHGASGSGKSTLLRSLYANYKPDRGQILVKHDGAGIDLVTAEPWDVIDVRRRTIGYVSQFLRAVPRMSALDVVAEPAISAGMTQEIAARRARALLARLRISERQWSLAPATFSGGQQQRVNIARGFILDYPVLLLDEPTASLDQANKSTVVELIDEAKQRGSAVVGIFHDVDVRDAVCDRLYEVCRPHATDGLEAMSSAALRPRAQVSAGAR